LKKVEKISKNLLTNGFGSDIIVKLAQERESETVIEN
jgi:hypothetical protein